MSKDTCKLVARLEREGFIVKPKAKGWLVFRAGNPRAAVMIHRSGGSDHRNYANTVADLKRVLGWKE